MPRVQANGHGLYYEDNGEGTPLIFIAGLGGDHRAFAVPARHFGKRFRVIVFDQRDSGRSDRSEGSYSTADLADDLAALCEAIELPPAHVVGQSLGGLVAQQLALRHPEKARSLMLFSSHAGSSSWKKAVLASWVLLRKKCDPGEFTRATLPWLVGPSFHETNPLQIEGLIRFAERNAWPQSPEAFERQANASSMHDLEGRLGAIRVPTMVVTGERDLVNPPEVARRLADQIMGAALQVLPGLGHIPHVENVGLFRETIEAFLDRIG